MHFTCISSFKIITLGPEYYLDHFRTKEIKAYNDEVPPPRA